MREIGQATARLVHVETHPENIVSVTSRFVLILQRGETSSATHLASALEIIHCICRRLVIAVAYAYASLEFGYIFRHRGIFKDYDQANIVEKKQNIHFVLKVSSFMLSSIFFSHKLESGRLIFQYKYLLPFHCRFIIDLLLARVGISHLIT